MKKDSNNVQSIRDEVQSSAIENQSTTAKVTWRDKPVVSILAKVFGAAAFVVSLIGLVLYCAVDGKGIGIAYKYIIAAWSGCLGVFFGVPGIVCSKDKTVKLIAIGCTAVASLLILLAIASVLNMMADEENGRYSTTKYSKSYDRTYDERTSSRSQYQGHEMAHERAKDIDRQFDSAIKALDAR